MEYISFGNTGVKVSRLGFGGAVIGLKNYLYSFDPKDKEDRRNVTEALEKALELGITYFDTAPGYGNGESEKIFGEVLQGTESGIFLASKVNIGDPKHVRRSFEESLDRLKRSNIDLLQIHGSSYTMETARSILEPEGMLDEMNRLKDEGLVRFIGFTSEDNNHALYHFIESGKFDMMQLCYNFIFQHPYEPSRPFGSLYEADARGMGITTMRAPTSGTFQRWIKMVNPGDSFDYTPALIQFVLSNPLVDVALVGMRSAKRVEQNVEICNRSRIDLNDVHERYV